jgi:hypothetical protein
VQSIPSSELEFVLEFELEFEFGPLSELESEPG